ncbi:MAG TPA: prepilin-type N-terminal cleavage/methylation domain-containing protein [Polyangiales bacterium]
MGPSRRIAGFSLIELMVVVTIVSILVLAMRTSFRKYQANKHTVAAAAEIVRMGRRARAESIGLGRAHLLYFEPGGGANAPFGRVSRLRGNALHCDHENWAPHLALCGATEEQTPSGACAGRIDLSMTDWYYRPHAIVLRSIPARQEANANTMVTLAPVDTRPRALCYDAFGRVFWSVSDATAGAMTFSSSSLDNAAGFSGAFAFVVGLLRDDEPGARYPGLVLSFPLGGNPRRLR